MRIVNLTRNDVVLRNDTGGHIAVFATSGKTASIRRDQSWTGELWLDGVERWAPTVNVEHHPAVDGLPDPDPDVLLLVPECVAIVAAHRSDVVYPYEPERDPTGRIVGCRGLGRFA